MPVDVLHGKGLMQRAYKASISMGVLYDEGCNSGYGEWKGKINLRQRLGDQAVNKLATDERDGGDQPKPAWD